jgi:hypothetical protein
MSKAGKIGIVLILVGAGLPLLSLFFVSNYDPETSLSENFQETEIVISERSAEFGSGRFGLERYKYKERKAIPFRYVLTTGVSLFIAGIVFTTFSRV